jgi:hypothetical protein
MPPNKNFEGTVHKRASRPLCPPPRLNVGQKNREEKTMQATFVALYRKKSDDLSAFLADCQNAVADILGSRFRKYEIGQIHATLVGLERDEGEPDHFLNRNFKTRPKC